MLRLGGTLFALLSVFMCHCGIVRSSKETDIHISYFHAWSVFIDVKPEHRELLVLTKSAILCTKSTKFFLLLVMVIFRITD